MPDVRIRLVLKDVTPDHALRLIVRQASRAVPELELEPTDGGFRVFLRSPEGRPETPEQSLRVTGRFKSSPSEPDAGAQTSPRDADAASNPANGALPNPEDPRFVMPRVARARLTAPLIAGARGARAIRLRVTSFG